jgi:hypothetical protein
MPFGGLLIGAGTSLISGFLGSSAASRAAKLQAQAGQAAAGQVDKATGDAISAGYAGIGQANTAIGTGVTNANTAIGNASTTDAGIYGDMTKGIQPYQTAGTYGLNQLQSKAGTFSFNPSDLSNDPGYQFQLAQGMKAIQNSAATRGLLQSGSTLKSTEGYAQGLAGTSFQNAYNRALGTYNTNMQGYQSLANLGANANSQAIQAGGLYGGQTVSLAGLGANTDMTGAQLGANVAMQGNEYIGNAGMNGAQIAGNFRTGAANAQAAGIMGNANAWSNALGGVANSVNGYNTLKTLGNMQSTGGGYGGGGYGIPGIGGQPGVDWGGGYGLNNGVAYSPGVPDVSSSVTYGGGPSAGTPDDGWGD